MRKLILLIILLLSYESGIAQYSSYQWYPTNNFPSPGSTQIYCLAKDPFAWGDLIVGGYTSTVPSPLFTSGDGGNNWVNEGCFSPSMGIYAVAPELSARGTKYLAIRHPTNTSINGIYRKHNTYGCQLRACQGLDVRAVTQKFGTVLGGVKGTGRGIYRSTNGGDNFTQIYSGADIYCFEAIILSGTNTMFAGGNYTSGTGILLKAVYPFNTWTEVAYVIGYVIGITVTSTGNIFIATHQGNIYRSISASSFEICRTGVVWDELKIPLTSNSSGHIFYGDWQTGMWYSTNNGTNWTQNNIGLPNNHVVDLVALPTSNILYGALGGSLSSHIYKFLPDTSTNIKHTSSNKPESYFLSQNYPNPFNPKTNIQFDLPNTSNAKLIVYDALGREVAILVNEKLKAGSYQVDWPAPTGDGSGYTSGVYFYRLEAGDFVEVKKMLLIK